MSTAKRKTTQVIDLATASEAHKRDKKQKRSKDKQKTNAKSAIGSNVVKEEEAYGDDDFDADLADADVQDLPLPSHANLSLQQFLACADGRQANTASSGLVSAIFGQHDFSHLKLKPDHASRPLWVTPEAHVYLEVFSPIYKHAYDFLIAIAEPVCRPHLMHEYRLTSYSLYAAASVGLETDTIIAVLNRLSKVHLPESITQFIRQSTMSYAKVSLVLQRNRYFVESRYPHILQHLLKDPVIETALLKPKADAEPVIVTKAAAGNVPLHIPGTAAPETQTTTDDRNPASDQTSGPVLDEDDELNLIGGTDGDVQHDVHSFEIDTHQVEAVKKQCIILDYPMLEEYDFRNDSSTPNIPIDLKPNTLIRPYQEKSLSKMFGNGRARSGIIVLPCGAGKTLVGITAACTVKKSTLVLCTSSVSVEQWRHQFKLWSTIDESNLCRFTADAKDKVPVLGGVTITTYTMVAFGGHRSHASQAIMNQLRSHDWGLLLLDEVHVVPANMFRKVISVTPAHCKLGLTATLVREDERVGDLNFLIGPKLYEANWLDLQNAGHLARVQCAEVWCPMTAQFYAEYIANKSASRRMLLYAMNPNKFRACQFLIRYHEHRGDKIIVFSDNLFALKMYAKVLKKPFIYGPTSQTERMRILSQFQHNPALNCIFISKVGDTSIDLPEATVIIQISSHYGSRRQEAQRLGRILRPKARAEGEFNAFFYTLVSQDTQEMYYSTKRQQFLIDQGYSFKVVTNLGDLSNHDLLFSSQKDQLELLSQVLAADDADAADEHLDNDDDITRARRPAARRQQGSMKGLSGGDDALYVEYSASGQATRVSRRPASIFDRRVVQHPLFKKRHQQRNETPKSPRDDQHA